MERRCKSPKFSNIYFPHLTSPFQPPILPNPSWPPQLGRVYLSSLAYDVIYSRRSTTLWAYALGPNTFVHGCEVPPWFNIIPNNYLSKSSLGPCQSSNLSISRRSSVCLTLQNVKREGRERQKRPSRQRRADVSQRKRESSPLLGRPVSFMSCPISRDSFHSRRLFYATVDAHPDTRSGIESHDHQIIQLETFVTREKEEDPNATFRGDKCNMEMPTTSAMTIRCEMKDRR